MWTGHHFDGDVEINYVHSLSHGPIVNDMNVFLQHKTRF